MRIVRSFAVTSATTDRAWSCHGPAGPGRNPSLRRNPSQRIARAIDWLKAHHDRQIRVEGLADHVQMSPLQYQKWLRLEEARRSMLNENFDAASADFRVGYDSPSQFSREYVRLLELPPKRDVDIMRRGALQDARQPRGTNEGWEGATVASTFGAAGPGPIPLA